MTRPLRALCALVTLAALASEAGAEEGGSGHYLPGSMASFMDGVSPTEAFLVRYQFIWYEADKDIRVPIAGLPIAGGVEAESVAHGLTFFWRPPLDFPENWSYPMAATAHAKP